ncbi:hypothetical protein QEN19_003675 [Hanseniaspora menglaensis]
MPVVYKGALCLAPMVRAGNLPTRILALQNKVDLVWSPEIIDKKIITCDRVINKESNTIDYLAPYPENRSKKDGVKRECVFRTHFGGEEKGKLIFQIGTSDPDLAVQAALKVIEDVDGIDVNSGCPKPFSVHSGCGAALLRTPDRLESILRNLVEKVGKPYSKPISVKVRILESEESTLSLLSQILKTGISNLTVHCRTPDMRNRQSPIREYIPKIYNLCKENNVSLIMNGGLLNKKDFIKIRKEMGLDVDVGGMFADKAEENPTLFLDDPLPWYQVLINYIDIAKKLNNPIHNTKYMLTRILRTDKIDKAFVSVKSYEEIDYLINTFLNKETGHFEIKQAMKYMQDLRSKDKEQRRLEQQRIQLEKNKIEKKEKTAQKLLDNNLKDDEHIEKKQKV